MKQHFYTALAITIMFIPVGVLHLVNFFIEFFR